MRIKFNAPSNSIRDDEMTPQSPIPASPIPLPKTVLNKSIASAEAPISKVFYNISIKKYNLLPYYLVKCNKVDDALTIVTPKSRSNNRTFIRLNSS